MNSTTPPRVDSQESQDEPLAGDHRFQLLVDAIKDYAIYLLDTRGRVSSWNTGARRLKGYEAQEILGEHFSRFYTPEDIASGLPERALGIALEQGKFEAQGWRVRKDGTRFWTSVVIDPIYDAAGRHIGFAKITRDITERKKAEEEMERARDALHHAQKLEALGRLTGGVAHDFNNFLTIIRSSVELLRRAGADEVRRERYIQAIAATAERAALLTRQLLAFARQQPLRPEVFPVQQRLAGLTPMIESMMGATVQVEVELGEALGPIKTDPTQFDTALLNLVINARDAMPDGGRLKISAHNVNGVPAVRRHAAASGDFVAIAVEDNGAGIEALTLTRIFEPFFTTKPTSKGTGLGLSQVYGFAKQSGGEIDVRSRMGEGSCFTLYVPRARASEVPVSRPAAQQPRLRSGGQLSILLVEDNDDVGQFASALLTEVGHIARRAGNADEALSTLAEQQGSFDLVFTDVVMPGMDGIELAKEIQSRWPDLPVVLTSGYSHVLAKEGDHGFALLQKPYSLQELETFLERFGRRERS